MSGVRSRTRMLAAQVRAEQLIYWRNVSNVVFSSAFPFLFLVFFGPFIDAELLVPGLVAVTVMGIAYQSLAIQLAMHREQGVLKRIVVTPLPAPVLVAAKACSAAIVVAVQVVVVVAVGVAAFGLPVPVQPALLAASILVGVVAFASVAGAAATLIPNGDAAPPIISVIAFPVMMVSDVFVPIERLPSWLGAVGEVLPLAPLVSLVRGAWIGPVERAVVIEDLLVLAAWLVVGLALAARWFRWEPSGER